MVLVVEVSSMTFQHRRWSISGEDFPAATMWGMKTVHPILLLDKTPKFKRGCEFDINLKGSVPQTPLFNLWRSDTDCKLFQMTLMHGDIISMHQCLG